MTADSHDPPSPNPGQTHVAPEPPESVQLCVVLLNYRTPKLVADVLATLDGQLEPPQSVAVVVDNDSQDGSAEAIAATIADNGYQGWARLVESGHNGGFAAGNNVGIRSTRADYYMLLNSDTLVRPGAIDTLLAHMAEEPDVGLASPRLEWPDGTPQVSCFRDHSPASELIQTASTGPISRLLSAYEVSLPLSDEPTDVEWTSFACVMIRREVIERVGLLDDGYFMYFEDNDYCRAARDAGFRIRNYPDAHVVHLRGGSSEVKSAWEARKRRPRYYYAARTRYYRKHYGGLPGAVFANVLWSLGRGVGRLRELRGEPNWGGVCEHEWRDNWTGVFSPLEK